MMRTRTLLAAAAAASAIMMAAAVPASAATFNASGRATNSWTTATKYYAMPGGSASDIAFDLVTPQGGTLGMRWAKCDDHSVFGQTVAISGDSGVRLVGINIRHSCVQLQYRRFTSGPATEFTGVVHWGYDISGS